MTKIESREQKQLKEILLLNEPLYFTQNYFKSVYNQKFIINSHHKILADVIRKIFSGEYRHVLITLPPRYTKTELMVKAFIAMGFAINPSSTFLHTSYSDTLALDNSKTIRDIIKSEFFQSFFPLSIKQDRDSAKRWNTSAGGGLYATSSGGQITGFGAGSVYEETNEEDVFNEFIERLSKQTRFSGAVVIDDPLKVDDAYSLVKREQVNNRFDQTIRSRVNSRYTPIVITMQRLHTDDLIGYLLRKEPDEWTLIKIPALTYEDGEYKALWPLKHTVDDLFKLQRINRFVFDTQYQQETEGIRTGGEFWTSFNTQIHVRKLQYNPKLTLHVTIDSNVYPYIAISIWQFEDQRSDEGFCYIRQIHEIPASDPYNSATRSAGLLIKWLQSINYKDVVFIYADQTTTALNTIDDDKRSFLDKFCNEVGRYYVINKRIPSTNPPVAISGEFVNGIYADNFGDLCIHINETCQMSIKDYQQTKKDVEGKILKKRIKESSTGISYEQFGHFSDIKRYIICMAFQQEFINFKARILSDKSYVTGGEITDRKF